MVSSTESFYVPPPGSAKYGFLGITVILATILRIRFV